MTLKEQILNLRSQGKSYNEIKKELQCSKGTIAYHCNQTTKVKASSCKKKNRAKAHPFQSKIESFREVGRKFTTRKPSHNTYKLLALKVQTFHSLTEKGQKMYNTPSFTVQDVLDKVGENPVCYLTGEQIDINKPRTYHFDHILPRSKGGENTLDNLAICTKDANLAKHNLTNEEFFALCKRVVEHQEKLGSVESNHGQER